MQLLTPGPMKRHLFYFLLICCLFIKTSLLPAQSDYMFKKLSYKEGLSNGQINVIHKDAEGYIWFGTASGLNRYNGYDFKYFRYSANNENSIPDDFIKDIVETGEGHLWIKTDKDWSFYDKRKEIFIRDISRILKPKGIHFNPNYIYVDKDKNEWFYDFGKSLYKYNVKDKKTSIFLLNKFHDYGFISYITEMKDKLLIQFSSGWLAAINKYSLKIQWKIRITDNFTYNRDGEIMNLFVDSNQYIWIYGAPGVWICTPDGKSCITLENSPYSIRLNDQLHVIEEDDSGHLWLGTDKSGLLILDVRKKKIEARVTAHTNKERSLSDNTIQDLYKDNEGIMWIGTYKQGVQYYQKSIFKFNLYPVGDINCIADGDHSGLWLGSNGNGLLYLNQPYSPPRVYRHESDGLGSNTIVCLLKDKSGRLWVGSYYGGLDCIDKGKIIHYRHEYNNPNSLANNNVWSLAEDEYGHIYIATLGGGLQCLDPQTRTFKTYNTSNSTIFSNYLHKVIKGNGHTMIIGSASNGLSIFNYDKQTFSELSSTNKKHPVMNVVDMCEDNRGLLWVGTRDGLVVFNTNTNTFLPLPDSIPYIHDFISSVVEGEDHSIWITSSKYIVNIQPQTAANESGYTFTFHTYDENDGLSNVFNQRSIIKTDSGNIIAGGFYGINILSNKEIYFNRHVPHVLFTGLLLENKIMEVGQKYKGKVILEEALNICRKLILDHTQDGFSLQLGSDDYVLPGKTRFVYKLEGADRDWQITEEGSNKITYAHIGSGTYTLKVKAVNNDGVEGPVSTLEIQILPPFYLSPWAYLCYIILSAIIIYYIRKRILKREQLKLHILTVEKEAEHARKTDEIKTRFFTNISHELRTPLTLIISPLEILLKEVDNTSQKAKLSVIYRNAQRLLNMVNQLLDFKKSASNGLVKNLTEGDIIQHIRTVCEMFQDLSENNNIRLTFFSGVDHLYMAFDQDKITQIIHNLLANAFKFTVEGERVDVSLQEIRKNEQSLLEIKVADTGIGISAKDKEYIFDRFYQVDNPGMNPSGSGIGLSLVKDYVTLHGGTIKVFDNIGKGTVFVINIPINNRMEEKTSNPESRSNTSSNNKIIKPLIFIIDDNIELQQFLKESLLIDFNVSTFETAEKALEKLEAGSHPKLILCDILLKQMSGFQFCQLVKHTHNWKRIPIILLSALQSNDNKIKGLSLGADDYMTKPFNMAILKLKIQKLIDSHKDSSKILLEPEPSHITVVSADEQLVRRATRYVEKHIKESDYSVETLSKEMGMSRIKLYKNLLRITGKSPIEFIRIIRMKRAAQLLKESQMTVSEIAYETGFNYPKYFAKYFKEIYHVSPSIYREKESGEQISEGI